ncbi:MAG: NUDIX domain-containing protein [Leptolyngbyaceae cyanobacterium CRU_2_3]|nr:NUDIX domain-containing protein [Leptolyngbyaceae cyanobacterium CRU_2_3]
MSKIKNNPQTQDRNFYTLAQLAKGKVAKALKATKIRKRIRGTVIIDTAQGILLVSSNGDRFSLPGGGAEKNETGEAAAIRELEEETGLTTISAQYLLSHVGKIRQRSSGLFRNHHEVFLVQAEGQPLPKEEIKAIRYYQLGDQIKLSGSAGKIIEKYWAMKQSGAIDIS